MMTEHSWHIPFDPSLVRQRCILVHVPTPEAESKFLADVEELGCRWRGGDFPTEHSVWARYEQDTVISINQDGQLAYCKMGYYDEMSMFDENIRCTFVLRPLDDITVPEAITDLF